MIDQLDNLVPMNLGIDVVPQAPPVVLPAAGALIGAAVAGRRRGRWWKGAAVGLAAGFAVEWAVNRLP